MTSRVDLEVALDATCQQAERWLQGLPMWPRHPVTADGAVSAHFGPTILSEQDCVVQFARHLAAHGVEWEDMHFELRGAKWLFAPARAGGSGWAVDLAIADRDSLMGADLPDEAGSYSFDAFVEFKLASNYWLFGKRWGAPARFHQDALNDVAKVAEYVESGVCRLGYIVVVEEADASFPPDFIATQEAAHPGVRLRILRRWAGGAQTVGDWSS